MPTHKSAEKRMRQTATKKRRNQERMNATRTVVRAAETAVAGKAKAAPEALRSAEGALAKAAKARVISKKAASRKTSRLAKRLNKTKAK